MNLQSAAVLILFASAAPAQNPLAGLLSAENLKRAERSGVEVGPGARPDTAVLRFPSSEKPGSLTLPVPEAARDWSGCGLTFEFVSDSTIRWELHIRTRKGETFTYRVQPHENVPVKVSISNAFLTRDYMNNRQFRGYWISNWANHIDLTNVEALMIRMAPNRTVTLRLGPFALARVDVPDEILLTKPAVDQFGQWIAAAWPVKVRTEADLRRAWKQEDAALARFEDFGFCPYGGWKERSERATGFFHTAQLDGRWWLVDPDGHLFFSSGPDCVRFRDPTRVKGREALFAKLPADAGETTDFYAANARLRYGAEEQEFVQNWKRKQEQRLKAWGFNTVANWSDAAMFRDAAVPYVTNVRLGYSPRNWQGFPDVISEAYVRGVEDEARRQCAPSAQDRYLIGYFIGNEPRWHQRNLVDRILADTEPSATQEFVRNFKGDRDALMETLCRRYFKIVADAIRKADPNHMVLGIRWAGGAPDPVLKANDVFEVFSINIYRFEPPREQIERIHKLTGKPVMIGEFHFGAAERGYAPSLVMVKDQAERGAAYQYYLERTAAMPMMIGAHWFQMKDQPVTGRFDGENYNIGLINQQDLPYPEMIEAAKAAHRRMYKVHAGVAPPVERTAKVR